ncbi:MAG: class II aldolase/adducin family protein [Enterocloster sp.]
MPQAGKRESGHGHACLHSGIRHAWEGSLWFPYYRPGSRELAEAVSDVICSRDSLLLANHGMVAAGKSPEAVLAAAEEIEENAHLTILLGDREFPLMKNRQRRCFGQEER